MLTYPQWDTGLQKMWWSFTSQAYKEESKNDASLFQRLVGRYMMDEKSFNTEFFIVLDQ